MDMVDCSNDLADEVDSFLLWNSSWNRILFTFILDVGEEISALTELTNDVDVVCGLTQVQRFYDVFMGNNFVAFHFIMQQHIVDFVGDAATVDDLNSHRAVCVRVKTYIYMFSPL